MKENEPKVNSVYPRLAIRQNINYLEDSKLNE